MKQSLFAVAFLLNCISSFAAGPVLDLSSICPKNPDQPNDLVAASLLTPDSPHLRRLGFEYALVCYNNLPAGEGALDTYNQLFLLKDSSSMFQEADFIYRSQLELDDTSMEASFVLPHIFGKTLVSLKRRFRMNVDARFYLEAEPAESAKQITNKLKVMYLDYTLAANLQDPEEVFHRKDLGFTIELPRNQEFPEIYATYFAAKSKTWFSPLELQAIQPDPDDIHLNHLTLSFDNNSAKKRYTFTMTFHTSDMSATNVKMAVSENPPSTP